MFAVNVLSVTNMMRCERAKRIKERSELRAARSSSSLLLEPSCSASKNPRTGTDLFHKLPHPRMLALVNSDVEDVGQIYRGDVDVGAERNKPFKIVECRIEKMRLPRRRERRRRGRPTQSVEHLSKPETFVHHIQTSRVC